jgi:hypothetical protein
MQASAGTMQQVFQGMQFPMTKEQIIEQARKQNVSNDIIQTIEMIPEGEYESADSLMIAIDAISQTAGEGGGGKSQSFGGSGHGETGEDGPSHGGSSQGFGGRGGE